MSMTRSASLLMTELATFGVGAGQGKHLQVQAGVGRAEDRGAGDVLAADWPLRQKVAPGPALGFSTPSCAPSVAPA